MIIGKDPDKNLYYLTVNGTTEVLSEESALGLLDALLCLLGDTLPAEPPPPGGVH